MTYSDRLRTFEKRNKRILALKAKGWSIRRLSEKFGVSYTRVTQILERAGR